VPTLRFFRQARVERVGDFQRDGRHACKNITRAALWRYRRFERIPRRRGVRTSKCLESPAFAESLQIELHLALPASPEHPPRPYEQLSTPCSERGDPAVLQSPCS
jgi:hypothetical protein